MSASRAPIAAILLGLLVPLVSGCFYSREIAVTQREVARQLPEVEFRRQFMLSLGPGSVGAVSGIGSFIPHPEARAVTGYFRDLRRVKIGVFKLEGDSMAAVSPSMIRHMQNEGWQTAVRVRDDDGGLVSVLYRERYDEVRDLYIFSLDESDLVMAKVSGNLTALVQGVLADHPEWFRWRDRHAAEDAEDAVGEDVGDERAVSEDAGF